MRMDLAAIAAVLAGIAVAGLLYWSGALVDNVKHFLKNRPHEKAAPEDAPPEEE